MVECFFGRMVNLFKMTTDYRLDQTKFDVDVDNCIYLTNEDIESNELKEEDRMFFKKYLKDLVLKKDEVSQKRREGYFKTKEKAESIQKEYQSIDDSAFSIDEINII